MNGYPNKRYHDRFEPVHPCRILETRACPSVYNDVCGDNPCARFESDDVDVWNQEVEEAKAVSGEDCVVIFRPGIYRIEIDEERGTG
jgi:hypothetical protein